MAYYFTTEQPPWWERHLKDTLNRAVRQGKRNKHHSNKDMVILFFLHVQPPLFTLFSLQA